ncbi:MAG: hypothetical protein LC739_05270 [Actinobacteria bacterium]|nr:hypothetical protein [Actinomycetota bacterium]
MGSLGVEIYATTTAATARSLLGDKAGVVQLEEAARRGVESRLGEFAARALNNRGGIALARGRLEEARTWFDQMIDYSTANELDAWYIAGVVTRAHINVLSGQWKAADRDLEVASGQRTCIQTEIESLVTSATLRARRGDPGSTELITETLARIAGSTDHDALVMGCALAMQGAWMGSLPSAEATVLYDELLRSSILDHDSSARGLISFWARRLDFDPLPGKIAGPSGLEGKGRISEASGVWEHLGFPVEAAITRAMVSDPDLDSVFTDLRRLGAEGVIRGLRRELERRGVKQIPRRASHNQNEPGRFDDSRI